MVIKVGQTVGAKIKTVRAGYAMAMHIRRAHWHTYWIGKGAAKTAVLKWIAAIVVNADR